MNIPITLINYALTNKVVNQFRVYIYLKSICSGHFKVDGNFISKVCLDLDLKTEKTFYNNLNWLLENKWVTFNSKKESYRVIGFDPLLKKLKIEGSVGAVFANDDIKEFRPFIYAASIIAKVRNRNWVIRQPVRNEGRTRTSMSTDEKMSYIDTLPVRYMAKVMKLDSSTISRYKNAASGTGHIKLYPIYENIHLPAEMLHAIKEGDPEESSKYLAHKGSIYMRYSDKIGNPGIKLKRRKIRPP